MLRFACIAIISVVGCSDEIPRTKPPPREVDLRGIDFDNPLPGDAPRLVSLLGADGAEVAYRAQVALVGIGEPAIPSLVEGLRRQECFFVRARSGGALASIGPSAIPPLLDVLNDPVYDQPEVITALGSIRPTSDEAVTALISLLGTRARLIVLNEIGSMVAFCHEAKTFEPVLLERLADKDRRVRAQAREKLDMMNPEWNVSVPIPEVCDDFAMPSRGVHAQQLRARQEEWSDRSGQSRDITNSIGMQLVLIPPGEFVMGSPSSEAGRDSDECPQQLIRITRPFYLGIYEVTQAEYERVMGSNPSWFSAGGHSQARVDGMDTARFPVEGVAWEDAVEFCGRLSSLADEEAAGRIYRLPTEAEWEYAARAGTTTPFHFGAVLNGHESNVDGRYPYGTSEQGPRLGRPTTVGSYSANAFGLHDMHGNVWEWCSDWYSSWYYGNSPVEDPAGPAEAGWARVIRGGGWNSFAQFSRVAYRRRFGWTRARTYDVGFRVVLSAVNSSGG